MRVKDKYSFDMTNDPILAVSYERDKNPQIFKSWKNFKKNMKLSKRYQQDMMQDQQNYNELKLRENSDDR